MLELKIPPLLLTALFASGMVAVATLLPWLSLGAPVMMWLGIVIMIAGLVVCVLGVVAFRRAATTVDPTQPEKASSLVRGGVYRFTRNPMYLGFLLMLVGLAIALQSWLGLILAAVFVPYMNKFQIEPEERALSRLFGGEFERFQREVRRWL